MKAFFRENPTIAFGLGLPLLLVAVFLLVSGVPALMVAPPQYEVLYATGAYQYQNGVIIGVSEGKVQVSYQGITQAHQNPRIWRYNPTNGAVTEIVVRLPPDLIPAGKASSDDHTNTRLTSLSVPDLAALRVDPASVAPDGYEFSTGTSEYSRPLFTGMFYGSRYRTQAILRKNGRSIRLPNTDDHYYRGATQFIGWVVPQVSPHGVTP
jgi:ABC-type dipeptide/oligopeptide/nickel transport system permease subunit